MGEQNSPGGGGGYAPVPTHRSGFADVSLHLEKLGEYEMPVRMTDSYPEHDNEEEG